MNDRLAPTWKPEGMNEDAVYDENGVDRSLIRWGLSLTMEERLQALQDHVNSIQKMRDEIVIE
jgi:hypothetical protein